MILGRPTNLWLGLVTAISGAVGATAIVAGVDPAVVATLLASYTGVAGALILVVANQPPTLNPGDKFITATPPGQPNYETTVATPPAPSKPVVVDEPGVIGDH